VTVPVLIVCRWIEKLLNVEEYYTIFLMDRKFDKYCDSAYGVLMDRKNVECCDSTYVVLTDRRIAEY
jgi:hypothetical protein